MLFKVAYLIRHPTDLAFIGVLYKFASKHGIKYILNGGNISTECVQTPLQYLYYGTDTYHIRSLLRRFGTIQLKLILSHLLFTTNYICVFSVVSKSLSLLIIFLLQKRQPLVTPVVIWLATILKKHFESRFTRFLRVIGYQQDLVLI